jgi:hypothetical protein
MANEANETRKHPGSCHCGAVKFEVQIDTSSGSRCNCTVCNKVGMLGGIVKPAAFRLLSGEENLSFYEWGMKSAKRYFCRTCGVTCFGRGSLEQLGGDYVSVNFNALDDVDPIDVKVTYWDGRHNNWEAGPRETPWPIRP